jgi:hypothetical protein
MASLNYDNYFYHLARGEINPLTDTFNALLVTSSYTPNKGTHNSLSDITNEVVGAGYTAGGEAVAASVSLDATNHRVDVSFAGASWSSATITARAAVIYKVGSDAAHSWLVGYADFGSNEVDSGGTFAVSFTTPLRIQN